MKDMVLELKFVSKALLAAAVIITPFLTLSYADQKISKITTDFVKIEKTLEPEEYQIERPLVYVIPNHLYFSQDSDNLRNTHNQLKNQMFKQASGRIQNSLDSLIVQEEISSVNSHFNESSSFKLPKGLSSQAREASLQNLRYLLKEEIRPYESIKGYSFLGIVGMVMTLPLLMYGFAKP